MRKIANYVIYQRVAIWLYGAKSGMKVENTDIKYIHATVRFSQREYGLSMLGNIATKDIIGIDSNLYRVVQDTVFGRYAL